jgi:hypothetical protein
MNQEILDIIIGISAIVGMGLGIYNLFHSLKKEKVKIKITPKTVVREVHNKDSGQISLILSDSEFSVKHYLFAFEIINKSNFPIAIDEIGFKLISTKQRVIIPFPIQDKKEWPKELAAKRATIVYSKLDEIIEIVKRDKISNVYVKTTDDIISYGNSKALRLLIEYTNKIN